MKKKLLRIFTNVIVVSVFLFLMSGAVFADFGDTALKKGMTHKDVAALQQKLHILGYFTDSNYTQYFGAATETAVIRFQKSAKITADGIAGKKTLQLISAKARQKEISASASSALKQGDSGKAVADAQSKLKALGLYSGSVNSKFDTATKAAVVKFQNKYGLKATGIIDKTTMSKLNSVSVSKSSNRSSESRREIGLQLVEVARQYLGKPYVWGASSSDSFDCSGFSMYIMKKFGVSLDHSASSQFTEGESVSRDELMPGDLVFFTTYKPGASHVGIYIGGGQFIHASSSADQVIITDLDTRYYSERYLGARRYNLTYSN